MTRISAAVLIAAVAGCSSPSALDPAIVKGCAEFRRVEASPLVQMAVVAAGIALPPAENAVGIIRAFGDKFCRDGAPAGDTTSTAQRVEWLAGVTADLLKAAREGR